MIERAYVHVQNPQRPDVEAQALLDVLPARGIEVETFTAKQMHRRRLAISPTAMVAGGLDMVAAAFKVLGLREGWLPTYPDSLRELLGRRVWKSTVAAVMTLEDGLPIFVKPRDREKRFTGFVYDGMSSTINFQGASGRISVCCSDVVSFEAEYRAYVVEGEVRGVCHYEGLKEEPPSMALLQSAITRLRESGEIVAGFSIDVGRLADGRWVIVECNDGFGLGLYPGLAANHYADLLCARWEQFVGGSAPKNEPP